MSKNKLALAVGSIVALASTNAFAEAAAESNKHDVFTWAAAAAGFAIGIGVLGGAMGQGRAVAAAVEGISRNPGAAGKIQMNMIIGLALIESLVLFSFLIAFLLQGKIVV